MKKALNLIITYLITLLIGVVVGTIFYSFYKNVLGFVAGTEIKFIVSTTEFYNAFFYVSFCVLFAVCLVVSYYKIRHPGGVPQLIAFILLSAVTWVVLIPCLYKLSSSYGKNAVAPEEEMLSKGYFRQAGDKVYYFTKDFTKNKNGDLEAPAVVINIGEKGIVSIEDVVDSPDLDLRKAAAPYKEILVKNTFQEYSLPLAINFKTIISNYEDNVSSGELLSFIGFLSFGLALSSIFALTSVFRWNLLNSVLVTFLSCLVFILNSHPKLLSFGISKDILKIFSQFDNEPILIIINFLLSFIFIVLGIILFIVRKHKEKSR